MTLRQGQLPHPLKKSLTPSTTPLHPLALKFAEQVARQGGRALVTGGFVRDCLWDESPGDIDFEVFGLDPATLEATARSVAPSRLVGRDFGVLKIGSLDVSLPRPERLPGGQSFHQGDHTMTLADAARRRDFTINTIAWDPLTGQLFDPFNGVADLGRGLLRHVAPDTFVQDPLRALRAIGFLSRFPLELAPSTFDICQELAPGLCRLPEERIFEEVKKIMLKGTRIGYALQVAWQAGIVDTLWPEVNRLRGCVQDPKWHPEGDVWTHTLLALDAASQLRVGAEREDLPLMLAVLCHDIGKPETTQVGAFGTAITTHGHENVGMPLTEALLGRMTRETKLITLVSSLVEHHMRPLALYHQKASNAAIRRLSTRVPIDLLVRVARSDALGRTTREAKSGCFAAGDWLLSKAAGLGVQKHRPRPIIQGRDLLELGITSGPHMGRILDQLYEYQLEGAFTDVETALTFAKSFIANPLSEPPSRECT